MKTLFLALSLFAPVLALATEGNPYPDFSRPGRATFECLSSNRGGQRFLGRQVSQATAAEEALYQCYLRTGELGARSCRVDACRPIGGKWRRLQ